MAHLIDKDALVAEIERLIDKAYELYGCSQFDTAYNNVLKSIDTLEVKEVDLQSEIDRVWDNTSDNFLEDGWKEFEDIAKHFFKLGLKESHHLTWKDINLIDHLLFDIKEDYDNGKLDKEEYYKEVLKKFKEQL